LPQFDVQADRPLQRHQGGAPIEDGDGFSQRDGGVSVLLNAANAALRPPGLAVEHRAKDLLAKEGQHTDGFVEFTAQNLGGAIMKPHPGPVFEPLRTSVRPGDVGDLEALPDFRGLRRPQKARAFDEAPHVLQRDEREIDMDERRPVEANQEPRLANVFAGECGEQPTDGLGDGTTLAHRRDVDVRSNEDHEIEIGVLIEPAVHERTAGEDALEAVVTSKSGNDAVQ
jgi:hypothetical protein